MQFRARNRVRELTAGLTAASLVLVFGAVLGAFPRGAIPRASDAALAAIPHVNAALSVLAVGTIVAGVAFIRRGEVANHRRAMLLSLGLFVAFLALYLYRVTLEGPADFPGPAAVHRFVYLPVLAIHILLALVCLPLLYYVTLLGLTRPVEDIYRSAHARIGRVAAVLWVISFALGVAVYAMLYVVY